MSAADAERHERAFGVAALQFLEGGEDEASTKAYISQTLRYVLIFATAMGVVLGSNATALLGVPYTHAKPPTRNHR